MRTSTKEAQGEGQSSCSQLLCDPYIKEPTRVCEVPLGGAAIRHRLYDIIFGFQRGAQCF